MRAWVGTSGWVYRHWRGTVYPEGVPQRAWLEMYAGRFPTVEINASFYRLPFPATFDRWRTATPDGFLFAVKASRYLTHIRRLDDPRDPLERFWTSARTLGPKLGPVLVQLPPRFDVDAARLRAFLRAMPADMRAAFEFRDRSWDTGEVRGLLDQARAAWVLADRPGWHVPLHVTGGWSYVRFHQGRPRSPWYPREKLRRWADKLAGLAADDLFVYFNNDQEGAAASDARTLTAMLVARGVDVSRSAGRGTPRAG